MCIFDSLDALAGYVDPLVPAVFEPEVLAAASQVVTRPVGVTATTSLDGNTQPISTVYSDATPEVTYGLDRPGRTSSVTYPSSQVVDHGYDASGRSTGTQYGLSIGKFGFGGSAGPSWNYPFP